MQFLYSSNHNQAEKFKKSLTQHREALLKFREQAKVKRDEAEQQKQQDAQSIEKLRTERDALQSRIDTELSQEIQTLRTELLQLRAESAALQKNVEEERARSSETNHDAMVVCCSGSPISSCFLLYTGNTNC